jgi:hypothetical protein
MKLPPFLAVFAIASGVFVFGYSITTLVLLILRAQ